MSSQPMQIVILAGGLGTRLRPLTDQIPKAMIPILGKPFISYQLQWMAQSGIQDVILSTGYLGNQIQEYVQDGKQWNIRVRYVDEGNELRGTGGALRLIYDHGVLEDSFLVTYGDSFLPISYKDVWTSFQNHSEPALMTVLRNQEKWDTSNACFDGKKVTLYDKKAPVPKPPQMQYIDYGLSAFQRKIFAEIPPQEKYDLADLLHQLSLRGDLAGFEVKQRFYEIGSLQGIKDLEGYFANPI